MSGPKVAPFPPDVVAKVEAMRAAHAALPMPERAGRSIGIKRKVLNTSNYPAQNRPCAIAAAQHLAAELTFTIR